MIITQCVILARASGKLIFIYEKKFLTAIFHLTWLKLRRKKLSLQACVFSVLQFLSLHVLKPIRALFGKRQHTITL